MIRSIQGTVLALASSLMLAAAPAAHAQPQYPSKPIRLVVPFSAGSATDILARIIGSKMGEGGTYQVIVDNRPGAAAPWAHRSGQGGAGWLHADPGVGRARHQRHAVSQALV